VSGVDPRLVDQLRHSGRIDDRSPARIFAATDVIGESTTLAYGRAETWLVDRRNPDSAASRPAAYGDSSFLAGWRRTPAVQPVEARNASCAAATLS